MKKKPDQTYSPKQAREKYLGAFSLSEIYRLIERGDLRAFRHNRKWIIFESAITEFLENMKMNSIGAEQHDRTRRRSSAIEGRRRFERIK